MDRKSEYEVQHFGFAAVQITAERKYTLQKFVMNALNLLIQKLASSSVMADLLLQQKEEVNRRMWQAFQEDMDALAALDRKYFTIPDHVLLPRDFNLEKGYTEEDDRQLDKKLAELKQVYLENSIMVASLQMESEQHDLVADYMEELRAHQDAVLAAADQIEIEKLCDLYEMVQLSKDGCQPDAEMASSSQK